VNDEVPNETPKTLIISNGVVNWDGVLKWSGKPEVDHVTHLWSWIKKPITHSLIYKCSYTNDIIKGDLWYECHLQWMEI
jgi:hypothetical protein